MWAVARLRRNMTPHMIGDLFGGGQAQLSFRFIDQGFQGRRSVTVPVGGAAGVGYTKLAENGNPSPSIECSITSAITRTCR